MVLMNVSSRMFPDCSLCTGWHNPNDRPWSKGTIQCMTSIMLVQQCGLDSIAAPKRVMMSLIYTAAWQRGFSIIVYWCPFRNIHGLVPLVWQYIHWTHNILVCYVCILYILWIYKKCIGYTYTKSTQISLYTTFHNTRCFIQSWC